MIFDPQSETRLGHITSLRLDAETFEEERFLTLLFELIQARAKVTLKLLGEHGGGTRFMDVGFNHPD